MIKTYLKKILKKSWFLLELIKKQPLSQLVKEDIQTQAAMIAKLDDSSWKVREAAVQALSQVLKEDAQSKEFITAKLHDTSPNVRQAVVQVLSQVLKEDVQSKELITAKLDDDYFIVREASVQGLSQLVKEDAQIQAAITAKLHDSSEYVRQAVVQAFSELVKEDAQIQAAIMAKLHDSSEYVRQAAVQVLSELVKEDAQIQAAIIAKLHDSSEYVRQAAVKALSKLVKEDRQTQAAITAKLHDSDNNVRQAAVEALSPLVKEDAQTQAAITTKLHDLDNDVRQAAVKALSQLVKENVQTQAAIIAKLHDSDNNVRQAAVHALLGEEIQEPLEQAIYAQLSRRDDIRQIALWAVASLVEDAVVREALLAKPQDVWDCTRPLAVQALSEFVRQGGHAIHRFVPWLGFMVEQIFEWEEDEGQATRRLLADAYAPHLAQDKVLFEQVVTLLDSPSWAARQGAAWALIGMPDRPAAHVMAKLRNLIQDTRGEESWPERLQMAALFINHHEPHLSQQAIAATLKALDFATQPWYVMPHLGRQVRKQAAQILGQLEPVYRDETIFARLVRLLKEDQDAQVRDAAYHALERLAAAPEVRG